jgi:uncharacterized tellurite resistance protein B-like protein
MGTQTKEILPSIAQLVYAVAKAERGISSEERIAFFRIIEEALGLESWIAQSHFESLDKTTYPSIDHACNSALFELRKYKDHLRPQLEGKAIRILKRVADSFGGQGENEVFIMDRFKKDLHHL